MGIFVISHHHRSSLHHGRHKAFTKQQQQQQQQQRQKIKAFTVSLQRARSCATFRVSPQIMCMDLGSFAADNLQDVLAPHPPVVVSSLVS